MIRTSTLIYSLHNLASKAKPEIKSVNDFNIFEKADKDLSEILGPVILYDVKQKIVDDILHRAEYID